MNNGQNKWFIQLKGTVQGPFNNENLLKALQSVDIDSALVWKRGLSEWIRASQWQKADSSPSSSLAPQQPRNNNPLPQPKAAPGAKAPTASSTAVTTVMPNEATHTAIDNDLFEKTFTQAFADGVFYRVQVNYVDQPLMSKNDLLQLITKIEDLSTISIQDNKTKEWKELYSYPELVEKLGVSRRQSQRVPILAQFNGKSSKSKSVSYRVITVSEGGMGFTENFDLKIGDEVEGQISSPHFFQPITVKADVIYAGLDGYIGLKFSSVTDEAKAAIIEYIKKFGSAGKKA
ncbi:MAG: PilZ domain-containing protein [Pseudobdellovibrio sp.]